MSPSPRQALLWSLVNAVGTKGLNFIVYLLLARELGPKIFGVFAIGQAVAAFLEVVCEHKFSPLLIQRPDLNQAEKSAVFWFQLTMGSVSALLLVLLALPLGRIFSEPELSAVLPWLALVLILNTGAYVQEALLKRQLQFKLLTVRSTAANLAGGALGITLAIAGFGIASLVAMALASSVAGLVVLWASSKWRPTFGFSRTAFMPLYRAAVPLAASGTASAAALHANMLVVGYFFGASVAGLYAFALRIYDVLMKVTTFSISDAALPIFAKQTQDLPRYRRNFIELMQTAGALTVGILMVMAALAPALVSVFFGREWLPAVNYLMLYLVGGALISLGSYNDVTLLAFGKTRQVAAIYFSGLALWVVQLPLLTVFGPLFPAVAWCVKEAIIFPVKARWALQSIELEVKVYVGVVIRLLVAAVLAGAAAVAGRWWSDEAPALGLALGLAAASCTFVLASVALGNVALRNWIKTRLGGRS